MYVRLTHACAGDANKLGLGAHLLDGAGAGISHGSTQAAHQLMDDGRQRALVGYAAFNAFRHQFLGTGRGILEVTVCGTTASVGHRTQRAHAAVGLVGTALEQLDFARRFFGTGEHGTHHHNGRASSDSLGQITGETNTAVRDQRHAGAFQCGSHVGNGRNLRYANAGNDTGSTDGARANAHLDGICAGLSQRLGGSASGDVAADHLNVREVLLDPADAVDHALGVAVCGINDDHINTGSRQRFNASRRFRASTNSGANQQATLIVLGSVRVGTGLFDVLDGHHALQAEGVVNDQHFLDAMNVQQLTHFGSGDTFLDGDQFVLGCHYVADQRIHAGFKANIAGSHDTDQITVGQHRHTGDVVLVSQFDQFGNGSAGVDGDRVTDHTGFEFLDLADFGGLLLDGHVLVDDAHATFLRHGNRQTGFGDGIHRSRQQRDVQFDTTGQTGLETHVLGQDLGVSGHQENVIKGKCFLANTQHSRLPSGKNGSAPLYLSPRSHSIGFGMLNHHRYQLLHAARAVVNTPFQCT